MLRMQSNNNTVYNKGGAMINKQRKEFPIIYIDPPKKVAIGWGAHETVANECKAANIKKALIVTTGLKRTGILDEINGILTHNGLSTAVYDKVSSNPRDFQVMEAYQVFKDAQCDGVVSVGGGSSHDCGKGVRLVAANNGRDINEMQAWIDPPWLPEMLKLKHVTIPQISVNTTAGTGAESTNVGVVTNTKECYKFMVPPVPGMAPSIAIIDPLLVRLMPQNYIAWTGFDAFTHAMEGYVNRIPSKHTSALAIQTMKLVCENLREFTYNSMNDKACENMCWAESMAGVGLCMGAGVGIIHGCGHVMAAISDGHHGLVNCILALPLERWNQKVCPDKFAEIASQAMGFDTRGMSPIQASDKFFEELERLLTDLNIKSGHLNEQLGIKESDLQHIAKYYVKDWGREGNPRDSSVEETVELLQSIL